MEVILICCKKVRHIKYSNIDLFIDVTDLDEKKIDFHKIFEAWGTFASPQFVNELVDKHSVLRYNLSYSLKDGLKVFKSDDFSLETQSRNVHLIQGIKQ